MLNLSDMNQRNIYRLQKRIERAAESARRLSMFRLILIAAVLVLWGVMQIPSLAQPILVIQVILIVVFVFMVRSHNKVKNILSLFRGRLAVEERQQAIGLLEFSRLPPWTPSEKDKSHPYLTDLNIVGEFSFLRLIDQTVSRLGKEKLYDLFLSNHVADKEIEHRTHTVRQMGRLKALRDIFLSRLQFQEPMDLRRVSELAQESLSSVRTLFDFLPITLAQIALVVGIARSILGHPNELALIAFVIVVFENTRLRKKLKTSEAYGWALSAAVSLEGFRSAVKVLEKYSQTTQQKVAHILEPFQKKNSTSTYVKKLEGIAGALGTRQNVIVHGLIHIVFPWDLFWTYRLEGVRKKIQEKLPLWEEALAQFEIYLSLAMYADANKNFQFAQLGGEKGTIIDAENLRHPMILSQVAVGNPLKIDGEERCILLTGSNMSGKSTFLRSAGINFLLAKAGLPVAADKFIFANVPLMTSLSAADSLQEGLSSFYGEVRRLKNILEVARQPGSVFFLVDEIFRGTNNRERLLGSQAYIKALVGAGAKGMVTSHDLELAQLENLNVGISNYHFKEAITDGKMSFTYKKNRGPCPTTNALMVMKLNGLPVE